jgi:uncharacterized protein YukE
MTVSEPSSLAILLEEYRDALSRHLTSGRVEFENLESAWRGLSECYEGRGAEEFRNAWEETVRNLQEYFDRSAALTTVLAKKIESLRQFDRSDSI